MRKRARVATVLTGAVLGAGPMLAPAGEAHAATENWEISVLVNGNQPVYQVQICGYNQTPRWVCTPGENISSSDWKGFTRFYKNNWWWHSNVRLWWDQHGSHSVNNCSLSPGGDNFAGTFHGATQHPGNWVQLHIDSSPNPAVQGTC
jgi:hypothetical protein